MKHLKYLIIIAFSFCLASCFDTVETVEIKQNGTGTYNLNMDMSKAFEMMKGFMSDSDLQKEGMNKTMDTTISFKSILDSAQDMDEHKRELLKGGVMHVNMDIKKSLMKLDMKYPFSSLGNLNELYAMIQKGNGGLNEAFKTVQAQEGMNSGSDSSGLNQINSIFDVNFKDGSYSKTVNKDRYDAFIHDEKVEQIKGMMSMMGEMNYTLILKLPKPAKTVSNKLATLSADKKTITLKSDLFSAFDNPQLMELKATY
ncbi:hypothetical protein [Pinibacter soli]|uniref:Lipoprotein n=1 Tax=Pinibacter soli TaxID=3044211 RepID=A0ABT6RCE5_9BACT|nr:hypothetical protein [Pinibacter soli]MDI3320173.1 hypothetical protein [Pinibacter soli]